MTTTTLQQPQHHYDDYRSLVESYFDNGWTDGLPIVPPTVDRVAESIEFLGRAPDAVIGTIPTQDVVVTVEQVVVNAVMAGCALKEMPLAVAAIAALLQPKSNAHGTTGSLASPAHMVLVSGPARYDLGINCRAGCFGPGSRPNAVVGRTIRLVLRNCCNAIPGFADRGAFSQPGRYSFCFGEDEEGSTWVPIHVERGFAPGANVATVSSFTQMYALRDVSSEPRDLLRRFATIARSRPVHEDHALGKERTVLVVFGPEHRDRLVAAGWSKQDVREFLFPLLIAHPSGAPDEDLVDVRGGRAEDKWGVGIEGGVAESRFGLLTPEGLQIAAAGGPGLALSWVFYPHWSPLVSSQF